MTLLLDVDNLAVRVELDLAQDLFTGAVSRVTLDEDQLAPRPEFPCLVEDPFDHPSFVTRWHDHGNGEVPALVRGTQPRDDPVRQTELANTPNICENPV